MLDRGWDIVHADGAKDYYSDRVQRREEAMSLETGVLVAKDGSPILWHVPDGRSAGYLPDSPGLWKTIWDRRNDVMGFAHSHPGSGQPGPSSEDLTTFAAVEAALGRRLVWWITSSDRLIEYNWEDATGTYFRHNVKEEPQWLARLRWLSYEQK